MDRALRTQVLKALQNNFQNVVAKLFSYLAAKITLVIQLLSGRETLVLPKAINHVARAIIALNGYPESQT